MPSVHANPPSAKLLIAHAETERATLTAPSITPARGALEEAEQRVTAADATPRKRARPSTGSFTLSLRFLKRS